LGFREGTGAGIRTALEAGSVTLSLIALWSLEREKAPGRRRTTTGGAQKNERCFASSERYNHIGHGEKGKGARKKQAADHHRGRRKQPHLGLTNTFSYTKNRSRSSGWGRTCKRDTDGAEYICAKWAEKKKNQRETLCTKMLSSVVGEGNP